jgi:Initiation factor 2 subunit family
MAFAHGLHRDGTYATLSAQLRALNRVSNACRGFSSRSPREWLFGVMDDVFATVWWDGDAVALVDQRRLPGQHIVVRYTQLAEIADAIRTMQVRGAPAIGCTAALGLALVAHGPFTDVPTQLAQLTAAKAVLDATRPTAVNLVWATDRVLRAVSSAVNASCTPREVAAATLAAALLILREDLAMCRAIGTHGAALIPARGQVLTPIAMPSASQPPVTAPRSPQSTLRTRLAGLSTSGWMRRGHCCKVPG